MYHRTDSNPLGGFSCGINYNSRSKACKLVKESDSSVERTAALGNDETKMRDIVRQAFGPNGFTFTVN